MAQSVILSINYNSVFSFSPISTQYYFALKFYYFYALVIFFKIKQK